MKEKRGNIFSNKNGNVSQELLLRYIRGNVTPEERRFIEELIADDPFLSDAVEGLMIVGEDKKIEQHLARIHDSIADHRKKEKSRKIPLKRILAVAATVAVLIIGAWFVNQSMQKSTEKIFSDEFRPYPVPEAKKEVQPDTVTPEKKQTDVNYKALAETQSASSKSKAPAVSATTTITKEEEEKAPAVATYDEPDVATPEQNAYQSSEKSITTNDNVTVKLKQDTVITQAGAPAASQSLSRQNAVPIEQKTEAFQEVSSGNIQSQADKEELPFHKEMFAHGLDLYNQGNYAGALSEFEMLLKDEPNNSGANFYAAVCYLALENADQALKKLRKLDNNKNGQYYEATLWYESLAYVKKGEKKSAINTLEKVIKLEGEHKAKAQEMLIQLK